VPMKIQEEIDLQEETKPKVLEALKSGPLGPSDLCKVVGGWHYITKRAVWSLVREGRVKFDSHNHVAVA